MEEGRNHMLEQCRLMEGIPEGERKSLVEDLRVTSRKHHAGELVIQVGEDCDYLVLLSDGQMKAEMMDAEGHVIKITDMQPPAVLAPAFLFGDYRKYPVNVTTAVPSSTLWISREELLRLLMKDKRVLVNYLSILSNQGQFLAQKVHFHAFHTLREKLLHYFAELGIKQGSETVELEASREELAEFFGVARPSLSRVISKLQQEGQIIVSGKRITLSKGVFSRMLR